MQCTAKSKRSGVQCRSHAVQGRNTCRMHGGTTAVGIASKAFKHGKRSKYAPHLPALALGAYSQALDSRELLALREEIALVDAQIISALEAMKVVPGDERSTTSSVRLNLNSYT